MAAVGTDRGWPLTSGTEAASKPEPSIPAVAASRRCTGAAEPLIELALGILDFAPRTRLHGDGMLCSALLRSGRCTRCTRWPCGRPWIEFCCVDARRLWPIFPILVWILGASLAIEAGLGRGPLTSVVGPESAATSSHVSFLRPSGAWDLISSARHTFPFRLAFVSPDPPLRRPLLHILHWTLNRHQRPCARRV